MPRVVEVTVPPSLTDEVISQVRQISDVVGIQVQRGASIQPEGDVITMQVVADGAPQLSRVLQELGIGLDAATSLNSSSPMSLVAPTAADRLVREVIHSTWEEAEFTIIREAQASLTALITMWVAGAVAAIGIHTNALHFVIAAMMVAPGFQPLMRISLGVVAGSRTWSRGLVDTLKSYAAMFLGGLVIGLIYMLTSDTPFGHKANYIEANELLSYWTTITWETVFITIVASAVGTLLVLSERAVLTAGVMIMLTLVPAATIAGAGLGQGDATLVWKGALYWLLQVVIVVGASFVVLLWKQRTVYRRRMLL